MLTQLSNLDGWASYRTDKTVVTKSVSKPGVVQNGATTNKISCKMFDFNFTNARIKGNVQITIPNVGSVFCGTHATNGVIDKTTVKKYIATETLDGHWSLKEQKRFTDFEKKYQDGVGKDQTAQWEKA